MLFSFKCVILNYVNSKGGVHVMANDYKIRLLLSKASAYKAGFIRAVASGDTEAAENWKKGYQQIRERIYELKKA